MSARATPARDGAGHPRPPHTGEFAPSALPHIICRMTANLALPSPRLQPLSALLAEVPVLEIAGDDSCLVDHQTCDSRQARPGSLFVAYPGVAVDSHRFLADAVGWIWGSNHPNPLRVAHNDRSKNKGCSWPKHRV